MPSPHYSYRCEYVRCNNPRCRSCPHGPYWYGYWSVRGRTRKRYFGRKDPRESGHRAGDRRVAPDPREAIFDRRTATLELALSILELPRSATRAAVIAAYRRLSLLHHADRGGDEREMMFVNAAFSYLKTRF